MFSHSYATFAFEEVYFMFMFSSCRSQQLRRRPWSQPSLPGKIGAAGDLVFFSPLLFFPPEGMELTYCFPTFKALYNNLFPFWEEITALCKMGINYSKALEHPKKANILFLSLQGARGEIPTRQNVGVSLLCQIFLTVVLLQRFQCFYWIEMDCFPVLDLARVMPKTTV